MPDGASANAHQLAPISVLVLVLVLVLGVSSEREDVHEHGLSEQHWG
jgi:hypothetical protein